MRAPTITSEMRGRGLGWEVWSGILDVRDFGAVADGVTDCTAAIQEAFDLSNERIVFFPEGKYRITAALNITNKDMILQGCGVGSEIYKDFATGNLLTVSGMGTGHAGESHTLVIRDLLFEGKGRTETTGNGVEVKTNTFLQIERCWFNNFGSGIGLLIGDSIQGGSFRDIDARYNDIGIQIGETAGFQGNVANNEFSNLSASYNNSIGIHITDMAREISISKLLVQSNYKTGLKFNGCHKVDIVNIHDENNNTTSTPGEAGILLKADAGQENWAIKIAHSGISDLLFAGPSNKDIMFDHVWFSNITIPAAGTVNTQFIDCHKSGGAPSVATDVYFNYDKERFGDGDTTPSVFGRRFFYTANSNPTTITDFNDHIAGQEFVVVFRDSNTTIDFTGTNLKGNTGADWSPAAYDHMLCVSDGVRVYCCISDNT